MMTDELFHLYKRVQNKDKEAERRLVEKHREKFPNSSLRGFDTPGSCSEYRQNLHAMYLHLTQ